MSKVSGFVLDHGAGVLCDIVPKIDAGFHHADAEMNRRHAPAFDATFSGGDFTPSCRARRPCLVGV
jgi:hypothetical protein